MTYMIGDKDLLAAGDNDYSKVLCYLCRNVQGICLGMKYSETYGSKLYAQMRRRCGKEYHHMAAAVVRLLLLQLIFDHIDPFVSQSP